MGINFDNTTLNTINYDNTALDVVNFNGTTVWSSKPDPIYIIRNGVKKVDFEYYNSGFNISITPPSNSIFAYTHTMGAASFINVSWVLRNLYINTLVDVTKYTRIGVQYSLSTECTVLENNSYMECGLAKSNIVIGNNKTLYLEGLNQYSYEIRFYLDMDYQGDGSINDNMPETCKTTFTIKNIWVE